jgi:hypothetical protein
MLDFSGCEGGAAATVPAAAAIRNSPPRLLLRPHHLIDGDRQVADAPAGGVEDGVGDGGRRALWFMKRPSFLSIRLSS